MTRNSIALMRDGSVMADSDLVDFLSGPTDSAIRIGGFTYPYSPPSLYKQNEMRKQYCTVKPVQNNEKVH